MEYFLARIANDWHPLLFWIFFLARGFFSIVNVSLTPELENLINEKVKSGLYNSASEVIRESLRLLQKQNMLKEIRRNELRRKIMPGVEQIRNGEDIELRMPEDFAKFTEQIIEEASEERAKSQAK